MWLLGLRQKLTQLRKANSIRNLNTHRTAVNLIIRRLNFETYVELYTTLMSKFLKINNN